MALGGTFSAQRVANTLWAYATMGREPGAGVMRVLAGRAEALAGTLNAQDLSNTLWAACVCLYLSHLCGTKSMGSYGAATGCAATQTVPGQACLFDCRRPLPAPSVFCGGSVDRQWRMEALKDMRSLTDACREAFVGTPLAPSATHQRVSETLRQTLRHCSCT